MEVLRTWIDKDSKKEMCRVYHNIDPESICIVGHRVYFAHYGAWDKNTTLTAGKYGIDLAHCDYFTMNPVEIELEKQRFDFHGLIGTDNSTGYVKEANDEC